MMLFVVVEGDDYFVKTWLVGMDGALRVDAV